MQRLTLLACALVAAALVALPAAAEAGWSAGSGVSGSFTVLRAVSPSIALAGGFDGVLTRTTDAGRTWSPATSPSTAQLTDVSSADGQAIFTLDARGSVQRSTDAGSTWTTLAPAGGVHPLALAAFAGNHLLIAGRRSLLVSADGGDSFDSVTPKLAPADSFRSAAAAAGALIVSGPRALLMSADSGRSWRHLRLPRMERGDSLLATDFVSRRTGFVLSAFRDLYRTRDAGRHWANLLGTGGAGTDIAFSDARHGFLAAPGFANRFDGYVLRTTDGGTTWRPQAVAPRFLSHVAAAGPAAYAIANEGTSLFATPDGAETGNRVSVGFRPSPRVARRGGRVTIRGRIAPAIAGAGVAVSMRSAGRWITRFVHTNAKGVFTARFAVRRRAAFVAQVPATATHGSAATAPVPVRVRR